MTPLLPLLAPMLAGALLATPAAAAGTAGPATAPPVTAPGAAPVAAPAPTADAPPRAAPGDPLLVRAWEGRYGVLGPRCGYRAPDWAAALARGLRLPPPAPGADGADARARRLGATAAAVLAGQHLFDRFGPTACEGFTDGVSLVAADRDAEAGRTATERTEEPLLPQDWLDTIWPEETAALLARCDAGPAEEPRMALLAGLGLVARTEGLSMADDARHARRVAAEAALDMLDAVAGHELAVEGRASCVRARAEAG